MKKILVVALCASTLCVQQVVNASEFNVNIPTPPALGEQAIFDTNDNLVSYGLIPNPFKIITKTATAPVRVAKAKIKAAKKAAKIAKKGVNTVKGIDGDGKGKGPSTNYEKTPYTKDKYYQASKKVRTSKSSTRDRYEDYEFDTKDIDSYESPYAKRRSASPSTSSTTTTTSNIRINKAN